MPLSLFSPCLLSTAPVTFERPKTLREVGGLSSELQSAGQTVASVLGLAWASRVSSLDAHDESSEIFIVVPARYFPLHARGKER